MKSLVISSILEKTVAGLIDGTDRPNGENLFSLSLFVEALCLGKEPLVEVTDLSDKKSTLGFKNIFHGSNEGFRSNIIVNGRNLSRYEITNLAEDEWKNKLSSLLPKVNHYDMDLWLKHYFLETFSQGYDIQPNAEYYPGHLSIHLALNSANWIPKTIISELQRRRELSIEEARKFIGQNSYRVGIPYLLRLVLREANSPNDIVEVTQSIRSLSSMRNFRNWANRLNEGIESNELSDKDYRSILDAKAKIATNELDSKSNAINILESVSFSANPTEPSLSLGISVIDLLLQAGMSVKSNIKNRHLAFISHLGKEMDTTTDIKNLVRKPLCVYNRETIAANNLASRAQEQGNDRGTERPVRRTSGDRGGSETQAPPAYCGI